VKVTTFTEAIRDFHKMVLYDEEKDRFVGWHELEDQSPSSSTEPVRSSRQSPRKASLPAAAAKSN
jgi:hypothetical protein